MTNKTIARFAGFAAGASMLVGFAGSASAVTVAELQAQIAALMAQLQSMQGNTGASVAIQFTRDLTVGSTGADVTALQNSLIAAGYLKASATGYFGALTKAAVQAWQAASGLPSTGYFGPLSRAKFGAAGGTTTGGTVGSTTGGTTVGGSTGITTPGAEGTLTVTNAPVSNSTVYEGQTMRDILSFKAEADLSDIALQRVKIDLGTDSTLYRDVLSKVYLVDDAGRTLASADLNNNTVVRNGSNEYEVTLTGFSSVIAKDRSRVYTIKADIQDSIESADLTSYTVTLSENGVRGIDGAGIDLYSPSTDSEVTKTITVSASLTESATLAVSTSSNTPVAQEVIAAAGANENEADKVVLLTFDIRAEKDDVELTDLNNFAITSTGGTGATASTTYLYVGNGTSGQLLGTDALSGSDSDFEDISYVIPANTTRTFTLAADVRNANSVATTFAASFTGNTTNVVAENTEGDTVSTVTGSATGNSVIVKNAGPVFSLVGSPTIVKSATASQNNSSTSTASATFNLRIRAVGSDVLFGNNASTTMPLVSNAGNAVDDDPSFVIYQNGAAASLAVASSTSFDQPSSGVVSGSSNSFTLQEGNEVTIPVSFTFEGRTTAGALLSTGNYAVGLAQINYVVGGTASQANFMAGRTEWRTPSVSLP